MREVAEAIELASTAPDLDVLQEEYVRLLGYPRGRILEGRALELADWARGWYAKNGRPWIWRGGLLIRMEGQSSLAAAHRRGARPRGTGAVAGNGDAARVY